jgi:hypothetical protein
MSAKKKNKWINIADKAVTEIWREKEDKNTGVERR